MGPRFADPAGQLPGDRRVERSAAAAVGAAVLSHDARHTANEGPSVSLWWTLVSESLLLAMLSTREPWAVIGLLAAQVIPPFFELRARGRSTRVFVLHMLLFVALLAGGWAHD